MIGFFKRALTISVSSNTVRATELELARRSLKIASSLLGTNLATTFAELRIVNLSRAKVCIDETATMSLALAAASIATELALKPYEVQHHAAMVMARGGVAEMATGEGKTIAVAMAAASIAAAGRSVHVATADAYLAARDHALMKPVFQRLGLQSGLVEHAASTALKKTAYQCDITYGTADTFAFDYLSDWSIGQSMKQPDVRD